MQQLVINTSQFSCPTTILRKQNSDTGEDLKDLDIRSQTGAYFSCHVIQAAGKVHFLFLLQVCQHSSIHC